MHAHVVKFCCHYSCCYQKVLHIFSYPHIHDCACHTNRFIESLRSSINILSLDLSIDLIPCSITKSCLNDCMCTGSPYFCHSCCIIFCMYGIFMLSIMVAISPVSCSFVMLLAPKILLSLIARRQSCYVPVVTNYGISL